MSSETPQNGGPLARILALLTVAFVGVAVYSLATSGLPPLAADRGRIDRAINVNLVLSGIVFLGAHVALILILLRRPHEARIPRENAGVEIAWTAITAVILIALLVNSELDSRALARSTTAPGAGDPLLLEVVGQQFGWNFRFPGEDGILGRTNAKLVDTAELNFIGLDKKDPAAEDDIVMPQGYVILPEGREVRVRLGSMDVIHSFFVAAFRVKRDAMPGIATEFTFTPTASGSYELQCAEHCGLGHYRMRAMVEVVPASEWASRVKEATQ